jgi:serine/threonine protein kinase
LSEQRAPVPEPSEIAGRYQVVKKLGAGAFGTVYKAKDKILGRMVAIKTIRLEGLAAAGTSLDELINRFKVEAQVSAQLKHPNIVTIYDVGESSGMSYLAMEFIDGVGLDRVIAGAGRLPIERAASLAAQVADALDFAHRSNVVHRDIKPANIMIEAGDRVKVTDFGIAKVTDSGEHLTMTGSLLGTPSYMSPEQARGAALDGRSDLFAVGAVFYEMLAGKKAFRGDSITGLIFKIITEEPPPIREFDPSFPDEIVRILAKSLAKTPEMRYQTGRDMADDLLALTRPGSTPTLRQAELATAPGMKLPATPPTVNAAPTLQGALETSNVGPATVVSPAAASAPPRRSPPPPPSAPARARVAPAAAPAATKSNTGVLVGVAVGALVLLLGVGAAGWYVLGRRAPQPSTAGGISGTAGATAGVATSTVPPASVAAAPNETAPAAVPEAAAGPATGTTSSNSGGRAASAGGPGARPAGGAAPSRSAGGAAAAGAGETAPPPGTVAEPPARAADSRFRYLDEEAAPGDGREAGNRAADAYNTRQGWQRGSGGFGTNRRFAQRERSPRDLAMGERPAVATLRHVMDREEVHKKATGRYGTLAEMARASGFGLDVPYAATSFQRKGYRFDLTIEEDGFRITAVPAGPGPRSFVGDDSGYIRTGLE